MKHLYNNFFKGATKALGFFVLLVVGACVILLFIWSTNNPTSKNILTTFILNDHISVNELDKQTENAITLLSSKEIIFTKKEIFDGVIGYYNTLITYLLGLLVLVTFFMILYIKWASKEQILTEIEKILKSENFDKLLRDEVRTVQKELEDTYQDYIVEADANRGKWDKLDEYLELFDKEKIPLSNKTARRTRGNNKKIKK